MQRLTMPKKATWLAAILIGIVIISVILAGCSSSKAAPVAANTPVANTPAPTTTSAPSATSGGASITLLETGSSLLYPVFNAWAPAIHAKYPNITVQTASTGSGTGISQAVAGVVNFGGTDAYMSDQQLKNAPGIINIPLAISAQQINYNLPGINNLNLSGPIISAIYQGTIQYWDDAQIQAANPGVTLPHQLIVPVHRSDGSGDTFLFTSYLSDTDPGWSSKYGYNTSINWPAVQGAIGAEGNSGVVQTLSQTKYSIGYVGISYLDQATQGGLGTANLKNKDGNFVAPNQTNITAAAAQMVPSTPKDERVSMIYAPGPDSYPIINYEYVAVQTNQKDPSVAAAMRQVLLWAIASDGGNAASFLDKVHFLPLPSTVVPLSTTQISEIGNPSAAASATAPTASASAAPVTLLETGSSLCYPIFNAWAPAIHTKYPNITVQTASTGSGTGISQAVAGVVNFGATDAYMSDQQLKNAPGIVNIPLAISAQQINYNLPGISSLNLSGPIISAIYQGTIKYWDNAQIQAANPGVSLPHQQIVPVHRSDGSGDTFLFTTYLSDTDPGWSSKYGYNTSINWPAVQGAIGAEGNSGVVQTLGQTKYSIGYVGISYLDQATKAGLGTANLKNKDGNFVAPNQTNITAAAAAMVPNTPQDERVSMIYAPGPDSYPIINYEYVAVQTNQKDPAVATAMRQVLLWAIASDGGNASSFLDQVHFLPLPGTVVPLSTAQINKIQ